MQLNRIYFLLTCISLLALLVNVNADETQDAKILEKCLLQTSTRDNLEQHLEQVRHYANWTEIEEVRCLTRCMATEKGWFDAEHNKWLKQRIVDELGADMYNYCRYDLDRPFEDACTHVFRGFRCLKQAELHVTVTYSTLFQCAKQLNASNEELLQYTKLKPKEVIPCLFECFANRTEFYDKTGNWLLNNWLKAFGPIKNEASNFERCRISEMRRRLLNKCAWMYEEYLCWEQTANEPEQQLNGDNLKTTTSTTTSTMKTL